MLTGLQCRLKTAENPLSRADRSEHLTGFSEQRLYFTKDEETARQQQIVEALEQAFLRLTGEVDDDIPADDHVQAPAWTLSFK